MKIFGILTNPKNKLVPYYQIILLTCGILFSMPILVMSIPDGGLDTSWEMALHKAYICGMVYGRDVLFTYGPLGFLTLPIFASRNSWLYSATYTVLVYALTLFSFSLYVRKTKTNLINTVISTFVFVAVFRAMFSGSDFGLLLSIFIFSYIYATGCYRPMLLCPIAFLYSLLPFIKFSSGIAGAITALIFLSILLWDRRYKDSLIFIFSGLCAFAVFSLLLIGSFKITALYVIGSLQISDGYSDAMTVDGDKGQILFAGVAWLCYIGLFTYNTFKKDKHNLIFLFLSIGLLFVSFKHGFVRQDMHVHYFYSTWLLVSALYYLKSYNKMKVVTYAVLLFTLALLYQQMHISAVSSRYTGVPVLQKLENLHRSFNLLRGLGAAKQISDNMEKIRRDCYLSYETIKILDNHTVDVFPWNTAVTELHGLNWHPRPVFQSYTAYTAYLDSINAKHFLSDSAPKYILYTLKSIDSRYPIFDEPATFRELLKRYEICGQDKDCIILQKKDKVTHYSEVPLEQTNTRFGQVITLPNIGDGLLFARIHVEYNLLGHISKFLFKPPKVSFAFLNNNQVTAVHRFIFSNAENGIFLSQYVDSNYSLARLWQNEVRKNITQIEILTKHPAFFKSRITVEFFKLTIKQ